ncbi:metalloregulator ArsR/SmtB family transcription factor [Dyella sp. EPa41]|uniref:ArsR/SmtB family transcription factor n=1 Tax=Dyella sp. EPa41 TaxID=1561194 RepID=UPI0019158801|nr:metalloregulator ArsR/SmtB family transcription factor [Dyella sp. EPa41]
METNDAIAALTALGHAKRLAIFRLLVVAGPDGRMAGHIGEALGMPGATLSFHLKELANAGLVTAEPQGRFVRYRAAFDAMNGLIAYLTHNCCEGSPQAECGPMAAACSPGDACC